MSQHKYRAPAKDGTYVEVQIGWDKPMQNFYCVVSPLEDGSLGDPLYSNLDDPHADGHNLVYFLGLLVNRFAISLPGEMIAAVFDDQEENRVNRVEHY